MNYQHNHPLYNVSFSERPAEIELIRQMAREGADKRYANQAAKFTQSAFDCNDDLFSVRMANEWLGNNPRFEMPKMLFDNFWFENELCIMFSDTNVGKSILAVQLGHSLSTGNPIGNLKLQMPATNVIYFDFEQSALQFEARYRGINHPFQFSANFFRAELNAAAGNVKNYLERVHYAIEETIRKTKSRVLIVDNLTFLSNEAERARDALVMMKFLKTLKSKHNLSILALAHTPKRNAMRPITNNDMQGSKMLINFCDSAFAIGRSQKDPDLRYLKQIKQRNATEIYGENRVCLFKLERIDSFIQFSPCGHEPEREHLMPQTFMTDEIKEQIISLGKQGYSHRQISTRLDISRSGVGRVLGAR